MHVNFRLWLSNWYNLLDVAIITLLVAASCLRYLLIFEGGVFEERGQGGPVDAIDFFARGNRWVRPTAVDFDYGQYATLMCSWSWETEVLRSLLAMVLVIMFVRLSEVLTFIEPVGVLIVIMMRMAYKLIFWMPLVLVWSIGFGFAFNILAPSLRLEGSPGPLHLSPDSSLDVSAGGPFFTPFWAVFGFYEPAMLADAPGSAFLTPFFLWTYLLFALVLLVNLLIAMFNSMYEEVMKNSDNEWKMSRVNKIKTYMMHYVVPVPFNLLFVPFDLLWIVWHAAYTCLYNNFFAPIFESEDDDASVHSASSRGSPAFIAPSRTPTPGVAQPRPDSPVALAVASASPDASPLHHPSPLRKEGAAYAAANATSSSSPLHR